MDNNDHDTTQINLLDDEMRRTLHNVQSNRRSLNEKQQHIKDSIHQAKTNKHNTDKEYSYELSTTTNDNLTTILPYTAEYNSSDDSDDSIDPISFYKKQSTIPPPPSSSHSQKNSPKYIDISSEDDDNMTNMSVICNTNDIRYNNRISDRYETSSSLSSSSSSNEDGFISLREQKALMEQSRDAEAGLINAYTIHQSLPTFLPPWISPNPIDLYHFYHADVFQRLHNEIVMFCDYLKPTKEEQIAREGLVNRLNKAIENIFPSARLELFGSTATHTQLPQGDVDFVLFHQPDEDEQRQLDERESTLASIMHQRSNNRRSTVPIPECSYSGRIFNLIALYLQKQDMVYDVEIINKARVPVMKFVDKITDLHVDITLNSDSGLQAVKYIQSYMKEFPQLAPLTMVIKYFLYLRGLSETFTGGIGSFVVQCLIITMLKTHPSLSQTQKVLKQRSKVKEASSDNFSKHFHEKKISKMMSPTVNLGVLLFSFFRMYAIEFNYHELQIDLAPSIQNDRFSSCVTKMSTSSSIQYPLLKMFNPFDSNHDMTSNSYNFPTVRASFLFAYHTILHHLIISDRSYTMLEYFDSTAKCKNINKDIIHPHITGTLLSQLLPTSNTLTVSRPPLINLPVSFLASHQYMSLEHETRSFFGQQAQDFLQDISSNNVIDNTGDVKQISFKATLAKHLETINTDYKQILKDDEEAMKEIECRSPGTISLEPINIYLLMKKAYSYPVLSQNSTAFEQNILLCNITSPYHRHTTTKIPLLSDSQPKQSAMEDVLSAIKSQKNDTSLKSHSQNKPSNDVICYESDDIDDITDIKRQCSTGSRDINNYNDDDDDLVQLPKDNSSILFAQKMITHQSSQNSLEEAYNEVFVYEGNDNTKKSKGHNKKNQSSNNKPETPKKENIQNIHDSQQKLKNKKSHQTPIQDKTTKKTPDHHQDHKNSYQTPKQQQKQQHNQQQQQHKSPHHTPNQQQQHKSPHHTPNKHQQATNVKQTPNKQSNNKQSNKYDKEKSPMQKKQQKQQKQLAAAMAAASAQAH